MTWPTYVPSGSTLVILFKIARARLMASSHNVALLTDARLISVTEEMNQISDDLRDAADQVARWHTEGAQPGRVRWSRDAELPIPDLTILAKSPRGRTSGKLSTRELKRGIPSRAVRACSTSPFTSTRRVPRREPVRP